jgi:hypothetical protein
VLSTLVQDLTAFADVAASSEAPSTIRFSLEESRARLLADQAAALVVPGPLAGPPDAATLKRAADAYANRSLLAELGQALAPRPEAVASALLDGLFPKRPDDGRPLADGDDEGQARKPVAS